MKQRLMRTGTPYALDVKRLTEHWPVPELTEGRVIPHEELAGVLNIEAGTQRYYGVVNSWRKRMLKECGVFMVWEASAGVTVLPPAGVLHHAETRTRQKIRQTGKAIRTFAWVDRERLDDTGKARLDHQMRVAAALQTATDAAKRQLAVELAPIKSLPKRVDAKAS